MFRIIPKPTFSAEVLLSVPGETDPQPLTMTFKAASHAQIDEMAKALGAGGNVADMVRGQVVGWDGVVNDAEQPVAFSPDTLNQLLDAYPASALEIWRSFTTELLASKRKN